jgi:hypothetical protein
MWRNIWWWCNTKRSETHISFHAKQIILDYKRPLPNLVCSILRAADSNKVRGLLDWF